MELHCRHLAAADLAALGSLISDDGGYSRRIHGRPSLPADAEDIITQRPPSLAPGNKHVLGLFNGAELVAVADVLRGYPTAHFAYLGLLQVAARHHGQGLGRAMHRHVLEMVRTWTEVTTVRLAVAEPNREQADPFWRRLGYTATGEVSPWGDILARSWELAVHEL